MNTEMLMLWATALLFMVMMLLTRQLALGAVSGCISTVTWFAAAGWWLVAETTVPGVAYLFLGLGAVCLIYMLVYTLQALNVLGGSKYV